MRYATPVTDGRLVSHFGHYEDFDPMDADETRKGILGREIMASSGHQPGLLPV